MSKISRFIAVIAGSLLIAAVGAQTCAIAGADGPCSLTGIVNTYYAGSGTATGTNLTLGVRDTRGSATGLAAGDRILLMQMQDRGASDFSTSVSYGTVSGSTAGQYEYATVLSVTGSTVVLVSPLTKNYRQNISAGQTFQVLRVPRCASIVITGRVTAPPWTVDAVSGAATGGVVALDAAGDMTFAANARVDVSGLGFRGGAGKTGTGARVGATPSDQRYPSQANLTGGSKGEGSTGTPRFVFQGDVASPVNSRIIDYVSLLGDGYPNGSFGQGAPGNAGGGGNDGLHEGEIGGGLGLNANADNSGGGGGGNQGAGGRGGFNWVSIIAACNGYAGPYSAGGAPSSANCQGAIRDAGGRGAQAAMNSSTALLMGGGGGAGGTNNNLVADAISSFPPLTANLTQPIGEADRANGALGPISSSGANGGGIVVLSAGRVVVQGGASVLAKGNDAYTTQGLGGSDSAGGGGAGGSVTIVARAATGATLQVQASGGRGGASNHALHGPGGSGGGGFIGTTLPLSAFSTSVVGGMAATDSSRGGTLGYAGSAYGAQPGAPGAVSILSAASPGSPPAYQCLPQLTVLKRTTTPRRQLGSDSTALYEISVQNAITAGPASGVAIVDDLPAPFTYLSPDAVSVSYASGASGPAGPVVGIGADPVSVGTAGGNSSNSFTLPPGGIVTLSLPVRLNGATVGTYQNPASVSYLDPTRTLSGGALATPGQLYASGGVVAGGANYASSDSTAEDVVIAASNLVLSKTANVSAVPQGGVVTFIIALNNSSTLPSLNPTTVLDTVPTGLDITSITAGAGWVCTPSSALPLIGNGSTSTISCVSPSVSAGATNLSVMTMNAVKRSVTAVTNVASVVAGDPGCVAPLPARCTAQAVVNDATPPSLRILKSANVTTAARGATIVYQLAIDNRAAVPSANPTRVVDTVPIGSTVSAVSAAANWSCTPSTALPLVGNGASSTITCSGSGVAASASGVPVATVTVTKTSVTALTNTVAIAAGDAACLLGPPATPARCVSQVTVGDNTPAELRLMKTANVTQAASGATVSWTVLIANDGSVGSTNPTTVVDVIPAGLTLTSIAWGAGWSCVASNVLPLIGNGTSSRVTCNGSGVPANSAGVLVATLHTLKTSTTAVTNTASITAGDPACVAPLPSRCNAAASVTDNTPPILRLNKTASVSSVIVGTSFNYTIAISNEGLIASSQPTTVVDFLPVGVIVSAMTPAAGWICTPSSALPLTGDSGSAMIACSHAQGVPAQSTPRPVVTLTARTDAVGSPLNAAVINNGDPLCPGLSRCRSNVTVLSNPAPVPVLNVSKTLSTSELTVGISSNYLLTVSNTGTAATTSASTVLDNVPVGLNVGMLPSGCNGSNNAISCNIAAGLKPGASVGFVIPVTPTASVLGQRLTNAARVTGGGDVFCPSYPRCNSAVTALVVAIPVTVPTASAAVLALTALLLFALGVGLVHSGRKHNRN